MLSDILSDILYEIHSHLDGITAVALRSCNVYLSTHITKITIINKYKRDVDKYILGIFGYDTPHILTFLRTCHSAITSSTIIQAILSEKYGGSDIDIIVPSEYKQQMVTLCSVLGSDLIPITESDYDGIPQHSCLDLRDLSDRNSYNLYQTDHNNEFEGESIIDGVADTIINGVYYADYNGTKINFITTLVSIPQHIQGYDLSIVQNTYNGDYLYIFDLGGILYKTMYLYNPTKNYLTRCEKYTDRGFKIFEPSVESDIKLLNKLMELDRPIRGQIKAVLQPLDLYDIELQTTVVKVYNCEHTPGFRCPLLKFKRIYKHGHIVPYGLFKEEMASEPYKYCSKILILNE